MLDVLIQTFNEEQNLPSTLASISGWVNRIVVVDSGSTDDTVKVAESYGAQVVHHAWEGYARQKNWALQTLDFQSNWVLILDADEAVSPELKEEILSIVSRPVDEVEEAGFLINRVFIFMGREIRHCGYFPSWNLRLFKRGMARYEDRKVHEHMLCDGPVGRLRHLLIHEDRRGLEHFFAKHNRYSTLEAEEIYYHPEPWPGLRNFFREHTARRRFVKSRVVPHLPLPSVWRMFYMYILRSGWLDGRAGWMLCNFIASYEHLVQLKYQEIVRSRGKKLKRIRGLAVAEGNMNSDTAAPDMAPAATPAPIHRRSATHYTLARTEPAGNKSQPAAVARALTATGDTPTAAPAMGAADTESEAEKGIPTLVTRQGRRAASGSDPDENLRYVSPWTFRQNVGRVLWMIVSKFLFRLSFHNWYGWRRLLLRMFGARIGRDVRVRPTVLIEIPWNVEIGDGSVVGDHAILYSLGQITIGRRVVISQYAHLCAGTHDYNHKDFPLLRPPITVGDGVWIAADAFVAPGVKIGDMAVIGARSSVFKDIPTNVIAAGNPAKAIRDRAVSTPNSEGGGSAQQSCPSPARDKGASDQGKEPEPAPDQPARPPAPEPIEQNLAVATQAAEGTETSESEEPREFRSYSRIG